jgi:hypothetical protein
MAKSPPSPAAYVTGIAWVLIIVSGWATLRLAYQLATSFGSVAAEEPQLFPLPSGLLMALIIIHLLVALFSIYGGIAMLRYRAWTRTYFATVLASIGLEACIGAGLLLLGADDGAAAAGMQGVKLAGGAIVLLLGLTAILLAWKFFRNQGIRSVLKED